MTVRLEYHYDLDKPTLDIIVRYVDEPSEQSLVKPASLLNVPTCDPEADATDYAKLEVTSDSDSVLVDDVRARNSVKN